MFPLFAVAISMFLLVSLPQHYSFLFHYTEEDKQVGSFTCAQKYCGTVPILCHCEI